MEIYNFNKGAQWLKCDLHIHTPFSHCSEYGGQTEEVWKNFFEKLEALSDEIKVIGITDYIFLDGYKKVLDYKKRGGLKKIELLLPVIELRIRDFVGSNELNKINFHIIFADDSQLSIEQISAQFLSSLKGKAILNEEYNKGYSWGGVITLETLEQFGKHIVDNTPVGKLTSIKNLEIGFNNISFELTKISELLGEGQEPNTFLKGKYLKAIGKAEWESFRWDGSPSDKKTIINSVDFVFSASPTIDSALKGKASLKAQNVNSRLLHCSDAHMFPSDGTNTKPKELGHCFTWLKADPTFDGLKQVLIEPETRIFIGKTPPIIEKVNDNRTKYIKELAIDWVDGYDGTHGKWFKKVDIKINPELVAIIGNKGSGKSALADIIGLCGYYKNQKDFSFLNKDKFRSGNVSKYFGAKLTWESNVVIPKLLSDSSNNGEIEMVKYLPQGYFEKLTNEISTTEAFQKEIENVVFTHLKDEDKLEFQSFNDLIEYHKQSVEREIKLLVDSLRDLNTQIIKLERKLNPIYKAEILNRLKQKEGELQALIEPIQVKNPTEDEEASAQNKSILEEIERIKGDIGKIELNISNRQLEKNGLLIELRDLKELKKEIEFKVNDFNSFKEQQKLIFNKYKLDSNTLLNVTSNVESLIFLIIKKEGELRKAKEFLGEESSNVPDFISLTKQLENLNSKLSKEQEKLDTTLRQYQLYLKEKKDWEEKKNKITGSELIPDTILFFKKELDYLDNSLTVEIQKNRDTRKDISEKIFDKKQEVVKVYKEVKQKLDTIIEENVELLGSYKINIDANLSFNYSYRDEFLSSILKNQAGTFYSNEGGYVQFNKLIKDIDFDNKENIKVFLDSVIDAIFLDKREKVYQPRNLEDQIKDPLDFYNNLFSLSFLDYNYQLMQGKKKLQQLSPGERGALLLIFYLLLDKDNKPLIIDQPEDNLDNHSVANILVPFIRKAKANRQIILVTHNPNLAVVSDAEQVIYVNIDKENDYTFEYESGSIENRKINERIVQVLEGAMPAFNKRKRKYYEEKP
jgi:ABC-type lipoprotein export system ATPase subunit